jgi:hypothetical protein
MHLGEFRMSEMIRKQFYIHKRHQLLLRKLAKAKGVSEAEIVRQAIEHEAAGGLQRSTTPNRAAWEEILSAVEARKAMTRSAAPYHWDRLDAYRDREGRFVATST